MKTVRRKYRKILYDIGVRKKFLRHDAKVTNIAEKIDKLGKIKIKNFGSLRPCKENKISNWKKIFTMYKINKTLVIRICNNYKPNRECQISRKTSNIQ